MRGASPALGFVIFDPWETLGRVSRHEDSPIYLVLFAAGLETQ
jgi:hypothetical protein